jgi:methanogenic corrinoid protein MtbC1
MVRSSGDKAGEGGWIASLTYKSTATSAPGSADLQALVGKARKRNRSLGITGMLLFEDGCFLQTLEGPPDKLDTLWASIKRDTRHDHIEVLSEHIVPTRLFSDCDLLLFSRLCDAPTGIPSLTKPMPEAVSGYVDQLVQLALDADDIRLNAFIAALAEDGWTSTAIVSLLIEPAARALGDAWLADECCEIDLTIGLSMLQMAGHAVRYSQTADTIRNSRYSVLLATAPGEPHMLGTSMLADQFTDAGWRVEMTFPDSSEALANQVRAQHPDAVDIGMSDALRRETSLERLRTTIARSRIAVAGEPIVISVGGRLFAEALATAQSVGADHARKTSAGASVRMAELVRESRKARGD